MFLTPIPQIVRLGRCGKCII